MKTSEQSFRNDVRCADDGIDSALVYDAKGLRGIGSGLPSLAEPGLKLLRTVKPSSTMRSLLLMCDGSMQSGQRQRE